MYTYVLLYNCQKEMKTNTERIKVNNMSITAEAIVEKIENKMSIWNKKHSAISARQVITLSDAFESLYSNGFISQKSYNNYADYVIDCCLLVINDYKYCTTDIEYKKRLQDYFKTYGLMENF